MLVTSFIRLKKVGFAPDRRSDFSALTADEEGRQLQRHRLVSPRTSRFGSTPSIASILMAANSRRTKGSFYPLRYKLVKRSTWIFSSSRFNPGGHRLGAQPDNAIYHLSGALNRLQVFLVPPGDQRNHAELLRANRSARQRPTFRGPQGDRPAAARSRRRATHFQGPLLQLSLAHQLVWPPCCPEGTRPTPLPRPPAPT